MKIDISSWKDFYVGDVFECSTTKAVKAEEIVDGDVIYITRSALDNGCSGIITDIPGKKENGNCITIGAEGKVAFYQDEPFLAGVKVYTLRNEHLNQNIGMFICTLLNASVFKYSYGRARILEKIKEEIIPLPVDSNGNPDWKYMDEFVEKIQTRERESEKPLKNSIVTSNNNQHELNTQNWKPFILSELFTIKYGVNLELSNCNEDIKDVNFVARTAENNGVSSRVEIIDDIKPQKAGLISVAGGGSVLSTFYQDEPFYSGRDLYTLDSKEDIDKYAKLFIITLIKMEKYKYSYGRQANKTLPFIEIKLPVDSNGKPDYQFMSNYIKSLPYGDRI